MTIHGGRLYVACWNPPYLQIWDDISTLTAATVPDVTLGAASDLGDAWHVSFRGDATTAPYLKARLDASVTSPKDFALLE